MEENLHLDEHTSQKYNQELEELRKQVLAMGGLVEEQCHKALKALEDAKAVAEKMAGVSVKIGAKAGESGKIFGSVNNCQVAEALAAAGYEVERKNIDLGTDTIRDLGSYTAKVKLHKEVVVEIAFEVVAE